MTDLASVLNGTNVTTANNRDAWATIRGFVYQALYTVSRWIDAALVQDSVVAEGLEDIDHFCSALRVGGPAVHESVKHRDIVAGTLLGDAVSDPLYRFIELVDKRALEDPPYFVLSTSFPASSSDRNLQVLLDPEKLKQFAPTEADQRTTLKSVYEALVTIVRKRDPHLALRTRFACWIASAGCDAGRRVVFA